MSVMAMSSCVGLLVMLCVGPLGFGPMWGVCGMASSFSSKIRFPKPSPSRPDARCFGWKAHSICACKLVWRIFIPENSSTTFIVLGRFFSRVLRITMCVSLRPCTRGAQASSGQGAFGM